MKVRFNKGMKKAPRDREILLKFRSPTKGKKLIVAGCWMAPGGDLSKEGWHYARIMLVPQHPTAIGHRAEKIKPTQWAEMPIQALSFTASDTKPIIMKTKKAKG